MAKPVDGQIVPRMSFGRSTTLKTANEKMAGVGDEESETLGD